MDLHADLSRQATTKVVDGSAHLRLTWQGTPKQKLSVFYDNQPHCTCNRDFSSTNSPEATQWRRSSRTSICKSPGSTPRATRCSSRPDRDRASAITTTRPPARRRLDTISAQEQSTGLIYRADTSYAQNIRLLVTTRAAMSLRDRIARREVRGQPRRRPPDSSPSNRAARGRSG